jgi:hypothetical protein
LASDVVCIPTPFAFPNAFFACIYLSSNQEVFKTSLNRRDTAINASTGVSVMAIEFLENHFW